MRRERETKYQRIKKIEQIRKLKILIISRKAKKKLKMTLFKEKYTLR